MNKEILRIGCFRHFLKDRQWTQKRIAGSKIEDAQECVVLISLRGQQSIIGMDNLQYVWKSQPICQGHFWLRAKRNPLLLLLFDLGIPECMFTHFKNSLLDKMVMLHSSTTQWFLTCSLCMFCIVSNFLQPITYQR